MKHKHFVSVRTAYYKHTEHTKQIRKKQKVTQSNGQQAVETVLVTKNYRSAMAILDHVIRAGTTKSCNVHTQLTQHNHTETLDKSGDIINSYYNARKKYKRTTGREFRSDGNTLFEHVVVLSEAHVNWLEEKLGQDRAKDEIVNCLKNYSQSFAKKFGFEELGFVLHFDEGAYDHNKEFKRNVHAHVLFFNYSFEHKKSNLKYLAKKGVDNKTGRTHSQNQHFVAIQDLAAESFEKLRFKRGVSKFRTLAKHLPKHDFLLRKLAKTKQKYTSTVDDIERLKIDFLDYCKSWFEMLANSKKASHTAALAANCLTITKDMHLKEELENSIFEAEDYIKSNTNIDISEDESITKAINNNKRKKLK